MIYIARNLHLKQCCQTHSVAHMTARAPNEPKMYTPPFGETKDAAPITYLISADTSRRYQLGI